MEVETGARCKGERGCGGWGACFVKGPLLGPLFLFCCTGVEGPAWLLGRDWMPEAGAAADFELIRSFVVREFRGLLEPCEISAAGLPAEGEAVANGREAPALEATIGVDDFAAARGRDGPLMGDAREGPDGFAAARFPGAVFPLGGLLDPAAAAEFPLLSCGFGAAVAAATLELPAAVRGAADVCGTDGTALDAAADEAAALAIVAVDGAGGLRAAVADMCAKGKAFAVQSLPFSLCRMRRKKTTGSCVLRGMGVDMQLSLL